MPAWLLQELDVAGMIRLQPGWSQQALGGSAMKRLVLSLPVACTLPPTVGHLEHLEGLTVTQVHPGFWQMEPEPHSATLAAWVPLCPRLRKVVWEVIRTVPPEQELALKATLPATAELVVRVA